MQVDRKDRFGLRSQWVTVFLFALLSMSALLLHAVWLPWQLLQQDWIYDGRALPDDLKAWDAFEQTVDGIWFMIVFGFLVCAGLAGAVWSRCLGSLQADAVRCSLARSRNGRRTFRSCG